jgi:heterodisulfide reductase subunit A
MEPRIGVFVCHCGVNIGGFVDVPNVVEYVKTLPNVVYAGRNLYTCADDGLSAIKNAIKEHSLNRVIVASCTPRTHAPLFRRTCEEAGLNKYLFEFVNIREHCSWVHMKEPEKATEKAKKLIEMGVAKAALLEPQEEVRVPVEPRALVLGGGVAGMSAALSLANQGFETHLVEKEDKLGGFVRNLHTLYQTGKGGIESINPLIEKVMANKKIKLFTSSMLKNLTGYIGNYDATIAGKEGETKTKFGTIIVATGALEYKPVGLYGYGEYQNVITLGEFEKMEMEGSLPPVKNIAFINCAGSRGQALEYCSRICCTNAIKSAMKLLEAKTPEAAATPLTASIPEAPREEEAVVEEGGRRRRRRRREAPAGVAAAPSGIEVTVFNRGITTYGIEHELIYNAARERGVKFQKFIPENPPKVSREGDKLAISYYHEILKMERKMNPDLIILAAPLVQIPEAEELSKMLKVPLGRDKFFLEAHVKLRPLDFATEGIYLCGTAHAPVFIDEAIYQAYGAASRASIPLARGYVQNEAITAVVDDKKCIGCGSCYGVCPYHAIELSEKEVSLEEVSLKTRKSYVNPAVCKGCGTCVVICPTGAIAQRNFTMPQISAAIKAFSRIHVPLEVPA